MVVNKPNGLLSEWDARYPTNVVSVLRPMVRGGLLQPVHRLDRLVSGALVLALRPMPLKVLQRSFEERAVYKYYEAITEKRPERTEGTLVNFLINNKLEKKAILVASASGEAKRAELEYRTVGLLGGYSQWQVQLHTGRFHQIRAQLAGLGCPIWGDVKYGGRALEAERTSEEGIALHCRQLRFRHPVSGAEVVADAPYPKWWSSFWEG